MDYCPVLSYRATPVCDESMYFDASWKNNESEDSNHSTASNSSDCASLVPNLAELQSVESDYPITGTNPILGNQVDMYRWQRKHPETWDEYDVASWIQCHGESLHLNNVCPEAFAGIDGHKMCVMQIEEFQARDPSYGSELYLAFNHVLFTTQQYQQAYVHHQPSYNDYDANDNMTSIERYINNISFDKDDTFKSLPTFEESFNKTAARAAPSSVQAMQAPKLEPREMREDNPPSPAASDTSSSSSSSVTSPSRRGRSKGKLWEFVLSLLLDSKTNPSIIRWEDRTTGVFRIVRSDEVARLWGVRKSNPSMTYEKMSRAMRYTRAMGFLADLPEGHNYPRKLTFKMGKNATGWRCN